MRERLYGLASLVWIDAYKSVAKGHVVVIPMSDGVWILSPIWVKHMDVHRSAVERWGARWSIPIWAVVEAVLDVVKACSGKEAKSELIKKVVQNHKEICEEVRDVL